MIKKSLLTLLLLYYLSCLSGICAKTSSKHPSNELQSKNKFVHKASDNSPQPTTHIDIDRLPDLKIVLRELGLLDFLRDFIKLGVLETIHLLRLSTMDFQIMSYEWLNITPKDITRLKERIEGLRKLATVDDAIKRPELYEREKLNYGRVYLKNGVQTFVYVSASFGGPPPIGYHPIYIPDQDNEYGCVAHHSDLAGFIYVVKRGICTFLEKSSHAYTMNASGILIVNSEDRVESMSSGLGIDSSINEKDVMLLKNLPIISTSITSWSKLKTSFELYNLTHPPMISIVPLKCGIDGVCEPVTTEEHEIQPEVTWGLIHVQNSHVSKCFQYLTSTFGGQLPSFDSSYNIVLSDPPDACEPLTMNHTSSAGRIIIAYRGSCRFDIKAHHIEAAGGIMMVVVDRDDNPLQRLGGQQPYAGAVGIPSILVKSAFLSYINSTTNISSISVKIEPGMGYATSEAWILVAHTEWETSNEVLEMQLQAMIHRYKDEAQVEIVDWLTKKLMTIRSLDPEVGKRVLTTIDTISDEL